MKKILIIFLLLVTLVHLGFAYNIDISSWNTQGQCSAVNVYFNNGTSSSGGNATTDFFASVTAGKICVGDGTRANCNLSSSGFTDTFNSTEDITRTINTTSTNGSLMLGLLCSNIVFNNGVVGASGICDGDDAKGYDSLSDLQTAVSNDYHNLGGTDIDTYNKTSDFLGKVQNGLVCVGNGTTVATCNTTMTVDTDTYNRSDEFIKAVNSSNLVMEQYKNITVSSTGYLFGQPLLGMLGSGIISVNESNKLSEINLSCFSGLKCYYSSFEMRLASGTASSNAKYCQIANNSITVTDDRQSIIYIDSNCAVQSTDITNYFENVITNGGVWDFANVVAYNGQIEVHNGIGLEERRMMKQRVINFEKNHLSVISGYGITTGVFPNFSIASGKYLYLMDIVYTPKKNTSNTIANGGYVEVAYHTGASTWSTFNSLGLNMTYCDTGSALAACTNINSYRRHFIFMVGYNDSVVDYSEIHQILPLQNTFYSTVSSCLDTTTNPLTYTLPTWYDKSAVLLYAYCGRASDSAWTTNFIDLRTVKANAGVTSGIDLSPYLTQDGTKPLTNNWNTGGFNITTPYINASVIATNVTTQYLRLVNGGNTTVMYINSTGDFYLFSEST